MMKQHIWRIRKEYFRQLAAGTKTLEIRVGYEQIKKVKTGDTITFDNYGPNKFKVERVSVYSSFSQMLKAEGVDNVLPGMTFDGAMMRLRDIYSKDKEALGVYAFKLKAVDEKEPMVAPKATPPEVTLYKASELLKENKNKRFAKVIAESYALTDFICEDYPQHCDHFWSKYVPGIFDGEREIITCYVDKQIAATAFLKKVGNERKISTIYVKPEYQKQGIKVNQFSKIAREYGWEVTQKLEDYYTDGSVEYVFNGTIDE